MHAVKLVRLDDAVGLALPEQALKKLRCGVGETVFLTETTEGIALSAYPPALQEQIQVGRSFIRDYRDALRLLHE